MTKWKEFRRKTTRNVLPFKLQPVNKCHVLWCSDEGGGGDEDVVPGAAGHRLVAPCPYPGLAAGRDQLCALRPSLQHGPEQPPAPPRLPHLPPQPLRRQCREFPRSCLSPTCVAVALRSPADALRSPADALFTSNASIIGVLP